MMRDLKRRMIWFGFKGSDGALEVFVFGLLVRRKRRRKKKFFTVFKKEIRKSFFKTELENYPIPLKKTRRFLVEAITPVNVPVLRYLNLDEKTPNLERLGLLVVFLLSWVFSLHRQHVQRVCYLVPLCFSLRPPKPQSVHLHVHLPVHFHVHLAARFHVQSHVLFVHSFPPLTTPPRERTTRERPSGLEGSAGGLLDVDLKDNSTRFPESLPSFVFDSSSPSLGGGLFREFFTGTLAVRSGPFLPFWCQWWSAAVSLLVSQSSHHEEEGAIRASGH